MRILVYENKKGEKYMTVFIICAVHQISSHTVSFIREETS